MKNYDEILTTTEPETPGVMKSSRLIGDWDSSSSWTRVWHSAMLEVVRFSARLIKIQICIYAWLIVRGRMFGNGYIGCLRHYGFFSDVLSL